MSGFFKAIAPGRICLFGEHQDYLNLPVIAFAMNLQATIEVQRHPLDSDNNKRILELRVPQMQKTFCYDLDNLPPRQRSMGNADFALAAIHESISDGWRIASGATCVSTTDIVMQAGCSSSTAFTIAWILVLAKLSGNEKDLLAQPIKLAQLAYKAEVLHFNAPGGTMDHVSISLGGQCLRIGPGMWEAQCLPVLEPKNGVWVLADSGDAKDTFGHLKRCKQDRLDLLQRLGGSWDNNPSGGNLSQHEYALLQATLTNRDTEAEAARIWAQTENEEDSTVPLGQRLGFLMNQHHEALRDGLGLSTQKLEAMREAAIKVGAWGYKLVGSGGGGCAIAWAPQNVVNEVVESLEDAGAKSTYVIDKPGIGARIEYT